MDIPPLANLLGFIALGNYITTLVPKIFVTIFPKTKKYDILKVLFQYRRQIGLSAFIFAFAHGFLLARKRNFDFFDLETYYIYIQGVISFIIFSILAITSNNWSIRKLKRNWKRIHSLSYLIMFFLIWHIWDKMFAHWTVLTPIGLLGLVITLLLFMCRKWLEMKPRLTSKNRRC